MSKIFYTSDIHFGHANVIKYSKRPFDSVEEMNEALIKIWNSKVSDLDTVYILGDMFNKIDKSPEIYLKRLNGKKILIKGNHEDWLKDKNLEKYFDGIYDYLEIKDAGRDVVLFHFPMIEWNNKNKGTIHLYGHVHNMRSKESFHIYEKETAFNVGVDVNDLEPCTLDEIIEKKKEKKFDVYI